MKSHRSSKSSGWPVNKKQYKQQSKSTSDRSWNFISKIAWITPHASKRKSLKQIEKKVFARFTSRYSNDKDYYNVKIINEIICNENAHIVASFKDYLINGDYSEFLQKYYPVKESRENLPKIFEYYESCSVIFPNYVILHESKYIYKNIQRKQRVIDIQQEWENNMEKMKTGVPCKQKKDIMFSEEAIDSIWNWTNTSVVRGIMGLTTLYKKDDIPNLSLDNSGSWDNVWSKIENAEKNIRMFHSPIRVTSKIVNCTWKKNQFINYLNEGDKITTTVQVNVNMNLNKESTNKGRNSKTAVSRNVNQVIKANTNTKNTNNSGYNSSKTNVLSAKQKTSATIEQEIHHHNINININSTNYNINQNKFLSNNVVKRSWNIDNAHSNNIWNNSSKVKKSLINSIQSSNKDIVMKAFREMNKQKCKVEQTQQQIHNKNHDITNHNSNTNIINNSNTKISSSSSSNGIFPGQQQTLTGKALKNIPILTSEIQNLISSYSSNKHKSNSLSSKDVIIWSTLSNNRLYTKSDEPWTEREPQKWSLNPELLNMWSNKISKIKSAKSNDIINNKKSTSSCHQKAVPSGSSPKYKSDDKIKGIKVSNKKHGTYINTNINQRSNTNENLNHIKNNKRQKELSPYNNTLNNKQIEYCTHYKSKTNMNIEVNGSHKKQPNIVIPMRKDTNIKGIQIKGFDELLKRSNSRNYYSDRMNTNPGSIKSSRTHRQNNSNINSKNYFDMFRTSTTKNKGNI